MGVRKGLLLRT